MWNKTKVFKNKWIKTTTTNTKKNLQNNENIMVALDKKSPPWVPSEPKQITISTKNDFFDIPFSFAEFNLALSSRNINSSPGEDGLDYQCLTILPIKYHLILLDIINEVYQQNKYPSSWKKTFIHFVEKSDKKSLRPIALTSWICKLFEMINVNRLNW